VGHVLGQLIPLAVAAALSMVPIAATIFILLSESRGATALPFLSGWVLGTAGGLTLATLAAQALPGRPRQADTVSGSLEILVGSALVLLGLVTLVRRPGSTDRRRPSWVERISSLGPLPAFAIGLALNVRPKALLLLAAAGLVINVADLRADDVVILIAVYTAIATSTVATPTLLTVVRPTRMEPRLLFARDWISAHGAAVTGTVMILIGVVVIGLGVGR